MIIDGVFIGVYGHVQISAMFQLRSYLVDEIVTSDSSNLVPTASDKERMRDLKNAGDVQGNAPVP